MFAAYSQILSLARSLHQPSHLLLWVQTNGRVLNIISALDAYGWCASWTYAIDRRVHPECLQVLYVAVAGCLLAVPQALISYSFGWLKQNAGAAM